jgi:hypothetical protein
MQAATRHPTDHPLLARLSLVWRLGFAQSSSEGLAFGVEACTEITLERQP